MNAAHLHLLLNHVPVIGVPITGVLLVLALVVKQQALLRIALGFMVFLAVVTVPVYLSGEPAEEIVEGLAGVPHAFIEEHEEIAQVTLIATEVLGALALLGLAMMWKRGTVPKPVAYGSLVLALIVSSLTGPHRLHRWSDPPHGDSRVDAAIAQRGRRRWRAQRSARAVAAFTRVRRQAQASSGLA